MPTGNIIYLNFSKDMINKNNNNFIAYKIIFFVYIISWFQFDKVINL